MSTNLSNGGIVQNGYGTKKPCPITVEANKLKAAEKMRNFANANGHSYESDPDSPRTPRTSTTVGKFFTQKNINLFIPFLGTPEFHS